MIIPNWNGESLLPVCLGSLRRQSFQDFELILALSPQCSDRDCAGFGLLSIGRCTAKRDFLLRTANGACVPIERRGWEHFR